MPRPPPLVTSAPALPLNSDQSRKPGLPFFGRREQEQNGSGMNWAYDVIEVRG